MDLSALLPPANGNFFAASSSEIVRAKLLLSSNRLASRQYNTSLSKHTGWPGHSNPFVTQPCKPLSLSLQIYASTWEGDTNNLFTETLLKSYVGEPNETFETENEKVERSIEAPQNSTQWIGGKYGPRDSKDITVPLDALKPGVILTGKVTNIEHFGAFVDVGAFSSGLIHISNLTSKYVKSVKDIVKVGDEVKVQVISVNVSSNRISFKLMKEDGVLNVPPRHSNSLVTQPCKPSLLKSEVGAYDTLETENEEEQGVVSSKNSPEGNLAPQESKGITVSLDAFKQGAILTGAVTRIEPFGAFVDVGASSLGLIHISNMANKYIRSVEDIVKVGDEVKVQVLSLDVPSKRISFKLITEDGDSKMLPGHSSPVVTEPCKPCSLSSQTQAAAGEGGLDTDHGVTETLLESEVGEACETFKTGNGKVEQSIEVSKSSGHDAPEERRGITVRLDVLKPGAVLTGKVTKIEHFGAFVDVGASSTGLVHISKMANKYVRSVEDVLKVGDDVKVQVLYVDVATKRLSLKLITKDGDLKVETQDNFQQRKETSVQLPYKSSPKVAGKPQKGQHFNGCVQRVDSSGVFVTLKQGHVGFLPASEVLPSGQSVETSTYFSVGQQVAVQVIRTTRDRIVLTMKKQAVVGSEEGSEEIKATSPFEVAFRRNKVLAKFLDERERLLKLSEANVENGSVIGSATEVH
ncbi:hypothetical protein GOP47_0029606 [Adiantum capillus-veneris]|nr:hypothetical protein GOP47_0029606 [Adiantum capillus-veneris]